MRAATMLQDGRRARARRRGAAMSPGAAARPGTLPEVFAATAARHPDQVALAAPDASLTYAELKRASGVLADRLTALGIGPGDRVGVRITSGTAELYVAILGVLCAGAAYVPLDAEDPESRAQALWRRAGVCAILLPGLEIAEHAPSCGRSRQATAGDDAWVIFTSGSTGEPNGVAVRHAAAVAFVDAEAELWRIDPTDRVLAGLSVSFDASCEEIWLAWRHGAALVPAPRALVRSGAELGPWIAAHGITVVSTVPSLAATWDHRGLDSVRLLILGGEVCPESLGWALAAGREVWNTYGPTEATVVSTAAPIRPHEPIVIGRPLSGWKTAVLRSDGSVASPGGEGELVIGGAGLGRYLDPEADAERFAPLPLLGWERAYRTGDIVRETASGLSLVGGRSATADEPARSALGEHPWRATGLETPVFADPSGRRARTMSGIGLALLTSTLLALVVVVTAGIGFSSMPAPARPTQELGARAAASTATRPPARANAAVRHARAARGDHARHVIAERLDGQNTVASGRNN